MTDNPDSSRTGVTSRSASSPRADSLPASAPLPALRAAQACIGLYLQATAGSDPWRTPKRLRQVAMARCDRQLSMTIDNLRLIGAGGEQEYVPALRDHLLFDTHLQSMMGSLFSTQRSGYRREPPSGPPRAERTERGPGLRRDAPGSSAPSQYRLKP